MKRFAIAVAAVVIPALVSAVEPKAAQQQRAPENPAIDMNTYLRVAKEAAKYRESHRLTEDDFIRMSKESGTIVLDARSAGKYKLMHIKDAINLSFPDITVDSLTKTLPDKDARILIYCNNNFVNSEEAFPTKMPAASLNLSTYIALYTYGYRNVYELGPQLDPATSKLPFVKATAKR
jgi:hypothetical protein